MRPIIFLLIVNFLTINRLRAADDFFHAIRSNDAATVRSMLEKDPSLVNARSPKGASAVIAALFIIDGETFFDPKKNEVLQLVMARHPKLGLDETAALGTAGELASMLRNDPGAVSRFNPFGWTLLHIAAFAGNAGTTRLLINLGAPIDVRAKTRFLNTPLLASLLSGQFETAKLLIEHGADVRIRDAEGFTPLHEAAILGRDDLVDLLLTNGAPVAAKADNGETVDVSASRQHHDQMAAMLKAKADEVLAARAQQEAQQTAKK